VSGRHGALKENAHLLRTKRYDWSAGLAAHPGMGQCAVAMGWRPAQPGGASGRTSPL